MFVTASYPYVLVAYAAFLQHGSCAKTPIHIRMCEATCTAVNGQPTFQAGFLFMRCTFAGRTKGRSPATTGQTPTAECLHGRELSTADEDITIGLHTDKVCNRNIGVTSEKESPVKESGLLLVPIILDTQINCGYEMNLANKTFKSVHLPWDFINAIVYIRTDLMFLFANTDGIRSVKLNANSKPVMVKDISLVRSMRYDEEKKLVFSYQRLRNTCRFSRMNASGDDYQQITSVQAHCCMALDTKRSLLYVTSDQKLFRIGYDEKVKETVVEEMFIIDSVAIDAKCNIVYYTVGHELLKKLPDNGQSSVIVEFKKRSLRYIQLELHSDVLYVISSELRVPRLYIVTLSGTPVVKSYRIGERQALKWLLCFV